MRRYVNLDSLDLQERSDFAVPIASLQVKRGTALYLEIQFIRDGVAELLEDASTLRVGFKEQGKYDADYVATQATWTTPEDADGFYTCLCSFDTEEADTLLLKNDDDSDDVVSVDLDGEIMWLDAGVGTPKKTNTFLTVLNNDVNRGDEAGASGSLPFTNLYAITGLTGGTATKLDGLVTAGGAYPVGTLLALNVVGEPTFWRVKQIAIATSTAANPTTITTSVPHGLTTGDTPAIGGHSLAGVNSAAVAVTVLNTTQFTIAVLGGGTGGYVTPAENTGYGIVRPDDFAATIGFFFGSVL